MRELYSGRLIHRHHGQTPVDSFTIIWLSLLVLESQVREFKKERRLSMDKDESEEIKKIKKVFVESPLLWYLE